MQKHPLILTAACIFMLAAACPIAASAAASESPAPQAGTVVQVRGVVLDNSGQPVIGAGVVEVGTSSNGTLTGNDGTFALTINRGARLEVSCIGYETITVTPVEGQRLTVILNEDAEILDEVVVMGYGTQRKKLVTGSTVNVTGEKLAAVNAVDAFGALQSQAAGVTIVQNSGQPGESYKMTIRGMGTAGSTTPLYVVDGVPGGDIAALSPNDIESIDVLKDAASSAIYGARAANGVVLVTTKKGKAGSKVRVTSTATMADRTRTPTVSLR